MRVGSYPPNAWGIWGAVAAGLITGIVIGRATEYYTSASHGPTRAIAAQAGRALGPVFAWNVSFAFVTVTLVAPPVRRVVAKVTA